MIASKIEDDREDVLIVYVYWRYIFDLTQISSGFVESQNNDMITSVS